MYRLWRDLGYGFGALLAGMIADAFDLPAAMWTVAGLTCASGVVVALRMTDPSRPSTERAEIGCCFGSTAEPEFLCAHFEDRNRRFGTNARDADTA